jgi:glyoxylase I family protein
MEDSSTKVQNFIILGLWGVRYQVKEVQRSIAFYTKIIGFNLGHQNLPAFGQVSIGNFKLILSGPGASGSRPMPDGRRQEPGGWSHLISLSRLARKWWSGSGTICDSLHAN